MREMDGAMIESRYEGRMDAPSPPPRPPELTRSERRLLGLLFRRGGATQAALIEATDLTQQSVSRLVGGLAAQGMVVFGEKASLGKRSYPSTLVHLAPDHTYGLGVAVMADAVALAAVDFAGKVRFERKARMGAMPVAKVLAWTDAALAEAADALGRPLGTLAGLGISVAGSFIGDAPGFNTPHSLEEWAGLDVARLFSERYALPAFAENDGSAAAMAEAMIGVGRWAKSFAYLYLGAGVGGGVVLNGELWRGRFGNAGEFAGGLPGNIYPFPNLELLRLIVAQGGQRFDTVDEMIEAYDPSWPAIDEWIARVRDSLSIIASNATAILDLEAIVIGGRTPPDLARRMIGHIELFDQKRRLAPRPTARLVPSEAPGEAAAIGAAMLPLRAVYLS